MATATQIKFVNRETDPPAEHCKVYLYDREFDAFKGVITLNEEPPEDVARALNGFGYFREK